MADQDATLMVRGIICFCLFGIHLPRINLLSDNGIKIHW